MKGEKKLRRGVGVASRQTKGRGKDSGRGIAIGKRGKRRRKRQETSGKKREYKCKKRGERKKEERYGEGLGVEKRTKKVAQQGEQGKGRGGIRSSIERIGESQWEVVESAGVVGQQQQEEVEGRPKREEREVRNRVEKQEYRKKERCTGEKGLERKGRRSVYRQEASRSWDEKVKESREGPGRGVKASQRELAGEDGERKDMRRGRERQEKEYAARRRGEHRKGWVEHGREWESIAGSQEEERCSASGASAAEASRAWDEKVKEAFKKKRAHREGSVEGVGA